MGWTELTAELSPTLLRLVVDSIYSGEELTAVGKIADEVFDYVERCRTGLQLEGGIRAGVDHIIRNAALPLLSQRPAIIAKTLNG